MDQFFRETPEFRRSQMKVDAVDVDHETHALVLCQRLNSDLQLEAQGKQLVPKPFASSEYSVTVLLAMRSSLRISVASLILRRPLHCVQNDLRHDTGCRTSLKRLLELRLLESPEGANSWPCG